ncbi:MAG: hypothetical protein RIF33_09430 [Cyclobacteriaceae bacterium]
MERLKHTSANIASLSSTRQRISPYRKTGLYMELHKLEYERARLETKLEKMETEKKNIEHRLSLIHMDMQEMLTTVGQNSGVQAKPISADKSQRLKY